MSRKQQNATVAIIKYKGQSNFIYQESAVVFLAVSAEFQFNPSESIFFLLERGYL